MSVDRTALTGKRIVLTGGTTGIGRATLALLGSEGARILTCGRHEAELQTALSHVRSCGGEVSGITVDLAAEEGVEELFAAADEELGGVDMLVANAALSAEPIHEMPEAEWRYVIGTNLIGYLACARHAIERMSRGGGGHLLFVGSISSDIKAPGESVYAATKAGIQAFAETLRKEVADRNIKVSLIQPGSVGTDMQECSVEQQREAIAKHEMLYAEEIADAICFALTRSERTDVVTLRIEPRLQKTA